MNKTANEIEALKAALCINQTDLAKLTGVDVATLSRARSGDRDRQISFKDIARMRAVLSGQWPARLLRARLQDELTGPGSKQIQILLRDEPVTPASLQENAPSYLTQMAPKLDAAMRRIAANLGTDPKLRSVVIFLAENLPEA